MALQLRSPARRLLRERWEPLWVCFQEPLRVELPELPLGWSALSVLWVSWAQWASWVLSVLWGLSEQ